MSVRLCSAVFLAAVFLVAVACGSEPAPPAAPRIVTPSEPVAKGFKVVVLGDSITAGLGLPVDQAFPAVAEASLVGEGLAVSIQNAGVSGDTSTGGAARVDWLLKQSPDVLVVELGGNDLLRGQPVDVTEQSLRKIVAAGQQTGAVVVLLGIAAPTSMGPEHKAAFDAVYGRVAESTGATFVDDFLGPLMDRPELIQGDGLHPTAQGQKLLAKRLVEVLRPMVPSD